jgi:hypothetical protein
MGRFSLKASKIAVASLCFALGNPFQAFAQGTASPQVRILEKSAGGPIPRATSNPLSPGAATEAQLLNEEEIAALSQRDQDPGPEVRGGALSNEHLTYIVIALAAIVLVLVLK